MTITPVIGAQTLHFGYMKFRFRVSKQLADLKNLKDNIPGSLTFSNRL